MNAGRSAALSVNSYLTLRNQTFLYRVYIDSVTQSMCGHGKTALEKHLLTV